MRRTDAHVRIDGGISRRARQILAFPIGHVAVGAWVAVVLCQTEVDHIYLREKERNHD
jgi:hypothetical protein